MVKIALDPTPFHSTHSLLEFPKLAASLGYEYLQLTPHPDFIPFFNHPKADDQLVKDLKKAVKDAGIQIASTLPVLRWSSPDPDAREAAVRYFKRVLQLTVELGVDTIGTDDNPEALRLAVKRLDMASAKRVIHPNTAARKKSRLMKKINAASKK